MAIQIPNPGTGNGASGDNEFVLWSKVKDNFTDQTNAASRLVGTANGNLVEMTKEGVAGTGWGATSLTQIANTETLPVDLKSGVCVFSDSTTKRPPKMGVYDNLVIVAKRHAASTGAAIWLPYGTGSTGTITVESFAGSTRTFFNIYTDKNTTKDSNGFIKAASPIVKVFADKVGLNTDAENQNVTYKKNGVGDYTITTVSGLSTDGWYIELPKDMNGNPKVAVTLTEVDGVISLKTYKRIFSMETFTFEPDLNEPLDIPDTRWIDLRLNEIPVEMPDDTQMEV